MSVEGWVCQQCSGTQAATSRARLECQDCGWIDHEWMAEMLEEFGEQPAFHRRRGRLRDDNLTLTDEQLLAREQHRLLTRVGISRRSAAAAVALPGDAADADDELRRRTLLDTADFDRVPDLSQQRPTVWSAFQLVLAWHVRALARTLRIDAAPLASAVGLLWFRYVDSRATLAAYRPRPHPVPRKFVSRYKFLRAQLRKLRKQPREEPLHVAANVRAELALDRERPGPVRRIKVPELEHHNRPRAQLVLALLWLASLQLRLGVLPSDLVLWCCDGSLPYFVAGGKFVLEQEGRSALQAAAMRPRALLITKYARLLIIQLRLPTKRFAVNMPLAMARAVARLELPRGVLDAYTFLSRNGALRPVYFDDRWPERRLYTSIECQLAAQLVIAIKARYGLGFVDAADRAVDFDDLLRWLTHPPLGALRPPDMRSLHRADSTFLAAFGAQALQNAATNRVKSRLDIDRVAEPLRDVLLKGTAWWARANRSGAAGNAGGNAGDQPAAVLPRYRRWRLCDSRQAQERWLDELHRVLMWHYKLQLAPFMMCISRFERYMWS